jgi:hypothetical protein
MRTLLQRDLHLSASSISSEKATSYTVVKTFLKKSSNQGQNLASTVLFVPSAVDSG